MKKFLTQGALNTKGRFSRLVLDVEGLFSQSHASIGHLAKASAVFVLTALTENGFIEKKTGQLTVTTRNEHV